MRRSPERMIAVLLLFAGALPGCTVLPPPIGILEEEPEEIPKEIRTMAAEIDRLQLKGELRKAIDLTERTLADFPDADPLRMRLAELRSQRQVCFSGDWEEAESQLKGGSPAAAIAVLRGIERYGDRDMVRRVGERIEMIRAVNPGL